MYCTCVVHHVHVQVYTSKMYFSVLFTFSFIEMCFLSLQIRQKYKQSLRKQHPSAAGDVAPPGPPLSPDHAHVTTPILTPSIYHHLPGSKVVEGGIPLHQDLPVHAAVPMKHSASISAGTSRQDLLPGFSKAKEKEMRSDSSLNPLKRHSIDGPIPPAKKRLVKRKVSSSNESSASEAPSLLGDPLLPSQLGGALVTPGMPQQQTSQPVEMPSPTLGGGGGVSRGLLSGKRRRGHRSSETTVESSSVERETQQQQQQQQLQPGGGAKGTPLSPVS